MFCTHSWQIYAFWTLSNTEWELITMIVLVTVVSNCHLTTAVATITSVLMLDFVNLHKKKKKKHVQLTLAFLLFLLRNPNLTDLHETQNHQYSFFSGILIYHLLCFQFCQIITPLTIYMDRQLKWIKNVDLTFWSQPV